MCSVVWYKYIGQSPTLDIENLPWNSAIRLDLSVSSIVERWPAGRIFNLSLPLAFFMYSATFPPWKYHHCGTFSWWLGRNSVYLPETLGGYPKLTEENIERWLDKPYHRGAAQMGRYDKWDLGLRGNIGGLGLGWIQPGRRKEKCFSSWRKNHK